MDKKTLCNILGIHTTVTNMESASDEIIRNIGQLKGKYICLTNVHTTTLAKGNAEYRNVQNSAWMALPDGKPIAFVQRLFGFSDASQMLPVENGFIHVTISGVSGVIIKDISGLY